MNEETKQKLDAILRNGYEFKFGDYLGRGFELLQKHLGGFILYTLVFIMIYFVASLVGGFIPIVGSFAVGLFLVPQLMAGFYLAAHQLHRGETPEFSSFFKGFDFIGQLALMTLVKTLLVLLAFAPFVLAVWGNSDLIQWYWEIIQNPAAAAEAAQNPPTMPPAWTFLLLLPVLYLSVAYALAPMFVVFYRLDFWNSLEYSRKLVTKKWFIFFAFYLVAGIIMMAGILLLCVGILASIPAVTCTYYAAFEDVTQLNREPAGDDIEKHLII